MATYEVVYAVSHPAGGTLLSRRELVASDSRTARDAIRALNPGCKVTSVRDLEAEAEIRRAVIARGR